MDNSITTNIKFRFPTEKYPKETAILVKAVNMLPDEVKEFLIKNPIMFSAEIEGFRANAMRISHEDFKDHKYLIHFNYHIWNYDNEKIVNFI